MAANGEHDSHARDLPVAKLLTQLSEQTTTLVRQELELAKIELATKGKKAGLGMGMFGGAGAFGFYAFGALTACLILALSTFLEGWLAALIVAALYAIVAGGLGLSAKHKVQEGVPPVPEQALESVKEDIAWTRQRATETQR